MLPTFFSDQNFKSREFTSPSNGVRAKDRAKALVVGSLLPKKFFFATDLGTKGAKKFCVDTFNKFLDTYCGLSPEKRIHYEIVTQGLPCKIYIDLEFDPREHAWDMEKIIRATVESLKEALGEVGGYVLLNSNRAEKTSSHLIFDFPIFKNSGHLKSFMCGTFSDILETKLGEESQAVDRSVYTKDRCFRLYGSAKNGTNAHLLPPGKRLTDPIDRDLLTRSLAATVLEGKAIEWTQSRKRKSYNLTGAAKVRLDVVSSLQDEYVERFVGHFKDLVEDNFGPRQFYVKTCDNKVDIEISPGVPCDITKEICGVARIHKSNNTYFTYYLYTGEGHFQCTDSDCIAHANCRGRFGIANYRDDILGIQEFPEKLKT